MPKAPFEASDVRVRPVTVGQGTERGVKALPTQGFLQDTATKYTQRSDRAKKVESSSSDVLHMLHSGQQVRHV